MPKPKGIEKLPPRWRKYIRSMETAVRVETGLRLAGSADYLRMFNNTKELIKRYEEITNHKGGLTHV